MKLRIICMFAVLSTIAPFYAQDKQERAQWTLEDCINYALEKTFNCNKTKSHFKKVK